MSEEYSGPFADIIFSYSNWSYTLDGRPSLDVTIQHISGDAMHRTTCTITLWRDDVIIDSAFVFFKYGSLITPGMVVTDTAIFENTIMHVYNDRVTSDCDFVYR